MAYGGNYIYLLRLSWKYRITAISPNIAVLFYPADSVWTRNHSFNCAFTEETYTIPLFAYERSRVIHIYSVLCVVSDVVKCEKWSTFLGMCNEVMVPGVFKVVNRELIFELCAWNNGNWENMAELQAFCDLVVKYTHSFTGPLLSLIECIATRTTPNLRRALMLCKDNLKDMDRRSEIPI